MAKNAIQRLSGDQKGLTAPCVPSISTDCDDSSEVIQSVPTPSLPAATNATRRPSGETWKSLGVNQWPAGGSSRARTGTVAGDGAVTAPMPGTIVAVQASDGDHVQADQVLIVLEAMKMEAVLRAPFAGTVTELQALPGRQVALGAVLCVVERPD